MTLVRQAWRFALVGGCATATHMAIGLTLAEGLAVAAFWANLAAFAGAVLVSYLGNLVWTFRLPAAGFGRLPRFLVVALAGLVLNQTIVLAMVDLAGWSYRIALICVVLVVPALTFAASRLWVFRPARRAGPGSTAATAEDAAQAAAERAT